MRKFVLSIAAAAMALTSFSAAPAAADNRNFERFVVGAGTILLLHELGKHGKSNVHHYRHNRYDARRDRHRKFDHHHRRHGKKKYSKRSHLPRHCLTSVRKNHRWVRVYNARCLRRHGY